MGVVAVLGGFLLGVLDFVWIKVVPFPFGDLGNSSAVWAVAAFSFGYWVRSGWVRAAVGAAVLLVVAVPSYYLAATVIQGDDVTQLWAAPSVLWMAFAVVAGVVFGVAGVWARAAGWWRTVGIALPAAVLFAEAALQARRIGDPSYGTDPVWSVVIRGGLGILVVAVVARTNRQRVASLAVAVPLALLGFAAFALAGFG
ncbi:hypothetical protein J3R04_001462 [Spirilliplanes yamanashiensis]|nr:hypothetical protein [Spirilliplanes yamanashiensis]